MSLDLNHYLTAFRKAAQAQGFREHRLADTPGGPLSAWTRQGTAKHLYLSAGIHGDEPAGPLALLQLLQDGDLDASVGWSICPALNPGGLAVGTRDNPDGVDLNRDYLLRSSREADAHASWIASRGAPDLFLSLHEDWESQGFYLYEINQGADQPNRARSILDAVQRWFDPEPGVIDGHRVREPGWIFHAAEPDLPDGWPEAIFLAKYGCPLSFTFETPSQAALEHRIAAHCAAVRTAVKLMSES